MSSLWGTERNKPQLGYLFLQLQRSKQSWENSGQNKQQPGSATLPSIPDPSRLKTLSFYLCSHPEALFGFLWHGKCPQQTLGEQLSKWGWNRVCRLKGGRSFPSSQDLLTSTVRSVEEMELKQQKPFGAVAARHVTGRHRNHRDPQRSGQAGRQPTLVELLTTPHATRKRV